MLPTGGALCRAHALAHSQSRRKMGPSQRGHLIAMIMLCKPLTGPAPLPAEDPKTITREWAHATAAMKMGKRPVYWETKAKPAADDDY